jgi:Ca-activated chloride channel homolog
MKKHIALFFLFMISMAALSQDWRDSLNYARKSYQAKEYAAALQYYQNAQKLAPKGIDLSDEIGQSAYKSREFQKAESVFEKSSSKSGKSAQKSRVYHNIGNARMEQKKYQGAIESYKKALRSDPTDEKTRYNLSEAIRRLREQENKKDKNKEEPKDNNQEKNKGNPPTKEKRSSNDPKKEESSPNGKKEKENSKEKNSSQIPSKTADRILDKLMKEESETKKKVSSNKSEKGETNSGKDW